MKYLNTTLKKLLAVRRTDEAWLELPMLPCRDKAGANHREWMEVNADWKTIAVSDKETEILRDFEIKDAIESGDHPFLAFNSAAFAVELGLTEIVKFLIEDKGVDPNSYGWTLYKNGCDRYHLVAMAMYTNRRDIFQYLVSLSKMRLWSDEWDERHSGSLFGLAVLLFRKEEFRNYVKGFLGNPNFDINEPSNCVTYPSSQVWLPCLHYCLNSFLCCSRCAFPKILDRYLDLIKALLNAGADANRSYNNIGTALDYFRGHMGYNSGYHATQVLQMMERAKQISNCDD